MKEPKYPDHVNRIRYQHILADLQIAAAEDHLSIKSVLVNIVLMLLIVFRRKKRKTLTQLLKNVEGNVTVHKGIVTFPDGTQFCL